MSALLNRTPTRNATGQILFTAGSAPPDHFSGGIPYEANGSVSVEDGPIDHYHQGLPYTANGRLATGGGIVVALGRTVGIEKIVGFDGETSGGRFLQNS